MNDTRLLELERRMHLLEEEMKELQAPRISKPMLALLGLIAVGGSFLALMGLGGATPAAAQQSGKEEARPTSILEAPVDVRGKGGKLLLRIEEGPSRLTLFGDKGKVHLEVFKSGGGVQIFNEKTASSFGYDESGNGFLGLAGKEGKSFSAKLGKDGAELSNDGGKVVARLGPSPKSGAGALFIGNNSGDTVVDAGVYSDGRGIVRAYPHNPKAVEVLRGNHIIIGARK